MAISVQPLRIDYSFVGARAQATDKIDAAKLDEILAAINDKVTELIYVMNAVQRDDDLLNDAAVDFRCLNDDVVEHISSVIAETVNPA